MNILEFWIGLGLATLAIGTVLYILDDLITTYILEDDND